MYLSDDFYEEPMSRGANCYAAFPYPFHAKGAVSARSGMMLAEYREKLALFTEPFYFRNEGFFTIKMASIVLALRGVETGKIIFEI